MNEAEVQETLDAFAQWFRAQGDQAANEEEEGGVNSSPPVDLFSLFGELRGMREDVKRDLRRNADFLEEFRGDLERLRQDRSFDGLKETLGSLKRTMLENRGDLLTLGLSELLGPVFDLFDRTARSVELLGRITAGRRFLLKLCGVYGELEGYLEAQRILQKKYSQNLGSLRIEVVGKRGEAFDSELMTAIEAKKDASRDSGTILEVVRHGFVRNGKALRCAEVIVSKKN